MTRTTLRRILVAVGALAAGYGVVVLAGGDGASDEAGGPVSDAMRRAADAALDSVRIEGADDTVVLRRREGAWRVDGSPADTARVAELEEAIARSGSVELASTNAANHPRLGVDSVGAARLTLGPAGGEPIRLLVGDRGPYRSSVYLRTPGTTPVYLARGELGRLVRGDADRWRDRTLVAVDTSRIGGIRVERGDATYRLRRSDAGWRLGAAPPDSARLRRLLGDLAGLEASGFAPDTAGAEPADRTVVVLGESDADTLARLRMRRTGPEGAPRYLVESRGRRGVFELDGPLADRLAPPRAELRGGAPGAASPAGGNDPDGSGATAAGGSRDGGG